MEGPATMLARPLFKRISLVLGATAIVCCALGWISPRPAGAQCSAPTTLPDINGLTIYARCLAQSGQGCNFVVPTDSLDICLNPNFHPCAAVTTCQRGSGYFQDGFDVTRAVLAYDRGSSTLFLGFRVAGI